MAPITSVVNEDNLNIALIDFSPFVNGNASECLALGKAIYSTFQKTGFVYLKRHTIPLALVSQAFTESAQYFERDIAEKEQAALSSERHSDRGYSKLGRERLTNSEDKEDIENLRVALPDLKESFDIGQSNKGIPNPYPRDREGRVFAATMDEFFQACQDLNMEFMRALALGMGLSEHWFDEYVDAGDNTLRLLHYPEVKREVFLKHASQRRAGEHSDYGSITLLFQDETGGLQVQSPNGNYIDATPIEGSVVIHAGDLLARWSNDAIKRTKHRVVEPPLTKRGAGELYPSRYSIAFFCNANRDKIIDSIAGTYGGKLGPKKYSPVNAAEYVDERVARTY